MFETGKLSKKFSVDSQLLYSARESKIVSISDGPRVPSNFFK